MEHHTPLSTVSLAPFDSSNFEWRILSIWEFGFPSEDLLRTSRSDSFFACADSHHALHQSFD